MFNICGWRTHIYDNIGGFLLEAKANWEHTCIAGGLFLLRYNKRAFLLLQKLYMPLERGSYE